MSFSGRLRATTDATGQALVLTVIFLVVLLGFAGFAIDVGHAYLVQRQLQAGVDAAALAGAQELPTQSDATTTAVAYGPTGGTNPVVGTNPVDGPDVDPKDGITFKCVTTVGCSSRRGRTNAISVRASSVVPTWFARIVGVNDLTVRAKATACSPCTAKKFDIMIVLDRTGSMASDSSPSDGDDRTDLEKAKDGIKQFLGAMDPELDAVGLAVFPPALDRSAICRRPNNGSQGARYGYETWWPEWDLTGSRGSTPGVYAVASPAQDYLVESPTDPGNWDINETGSSLIQTLNCVLPAGSTSYANALADAKHELVVRGRNDAQDVIVFFTDGAANTMPAHGALPSPAVDNLPPLDLETYGTIPAQSNPAIPLRPCQAAVHAANWAGNRNSGPGGTQIYTIGYDVGDGENCGGTDGYTADRALGEMASDPLADYFQADATADLGAIFDRIAADLIKPAGQLIGDDLR